MVRVLSAGDKCKGNDGNDTNEVLSVPDWDKGIMLHENRDWLAKVQRAVQEDIERVSQRLNF
jgi:hypothetical protein